MPEHYSYHPVSPDPDNVRPPETLPLRGITPNSAETLIGPDSQSNVRENTRWRRTTTTTTIARTDMIESHGSSRRLRTQNRRWVAQFVSVAAVAPFLFLAGIAFWLNNRAVEYESWDRMQLAMKVLATFFPIVFAAVVGQTMRQAARWKLERGSLLGLLEQLMGSMTVLGAISTQLAMRSFNILGLCLFLVWALSPLGAQSVLRIMSADLRKNASLVALAHFDTNNAGVMSANISYWQAKSPAPDNLYFTALLTASTTRSSTSDFWGNVKLPLIGELDQQDSAGNTSGWREIQNYTLVKTYPSLLGIPVSGLSRVGNTTFNINSSYFDVDCRTVANDSGSGVWPSRVNYTAYKFFTYLNPSNNGTELNSNSNSMEKYSAPIIRWISPNYSPSNYRGVTYADCIVHEQFVEVAVNCECPDIGASSSRGDCFASAVRLQRRTSPRSQSIFSNIHLFDQFATALKSATPVTHPGTPSFMEQYMASPNGTVGEEVPATDLFRLSKEVFSQRLMHLINTFYIARLGPIIMTGDFPWTSENAAYGYLSSAPIKSISGVFTQRDTIPTCTMNWGWWSMFLFASLFMVGASVVSFTLASRTLNPDILGYISTFTRDNPQLYHIASVSSAVSGLERARAMGDVSIRFGDVRSDDPTKGELGIGETKWTSRSESSRYYQ
ncbi:uncharacterized protein BDW43DRAFT_315487 [Aspergillus alliaceus]|uniref:uncharacterized protein n=1 Tax=Petromyces alliaceus TaxID=209559 RepID=UPI0012A6565D|nr:uncharacterized protein BDW43DRAFT_315487 [Aspergillus alliaceus]KAB8228846.1 hypothetical protein BDW43DRAFT_315487 [Aspergillus alliaceus]